MNKQELIGKIENLKGLTIYDKLVDFESEMIPKKEILDIVKQLDEPEKPVVPQYVADMIVKRKNQGDSLVATLVNLGAFGDAQRWIRKGDNGDTFAKAWLFGYEVEKEQLYTARLRLVSDKKYGFINKQKKYNKLFISSLDDLGGKVQCYFTQEELKGLNVWDNPAFEVKEVEE